ncbi:MAG: MFS transporter [Proteobacteria bacterium]|nr:MFS transporter [Pseudomonadota bacterium]
MEAGAAAPAPERPEASAPWPSAPYAWWVVAVLTLTQALAFVDRQVLALLVEPIKRDLHVSDTQISLLYGLTFALFYVAVALPIARLADSSNRRNIVAGAVTVWSLMTGLCGLAGNFPQLVAARLGVGAGEAGLSPAAQSMMADYFPKERLSAALGLFSMGISLGGGLALIGGGALIAEAPRIAHWLSPDHAMPAWRIVMLAVGLPGLLVAALFVTVREPARRGSGTTALPLSDVLAWLSRHRWTYLGLMGALSMMVFVGQAGSAWIPAFFERRFGWTGPEVGARYGPLVLVCGGAGFLAGGLIASWLRRGRAPRAYLQVGLVGFALAAAFATAFPLAPSANAALTLIGAMGFFAGLPSGGGYAALQEITPARMRAQVTAFNGLMVNLIGAGLGPLSVGLITDYGFHDARKIQLSLTLVAAVAGPVTLAAFALALRGYAKASEAAGAR